MDTPPKPKKKRTKRKHKRLSKPFIAYLRRAIDTFQYDVKGFALAHEIPYFTVYSAYRGYTYKKANGPVRRHLERPYVAQKTKDKIVALRNKGATYAQLAKAAGLCEPTIKGIIKESKRALVIDMYKRGREYKHIIKKTRLRKPTLQKFVRQHKIQEQIESLKRSRP